MKWRGTMLLALLALLLPGASQALDLDAALRGSSEWDSNVKRTDGPGRTDDFIFRVTPLVRLLEDRGKFQWNLDYRFPYEVAVKTNKVDGFYHFLNANSDYYLSERTRIFAREAFSKSDALGRNDAAEGGDIPTVGSFRADVYRNRAELGLSHSFTPRLAGDFSLSHRYFDTDLANRSQTNVLVGTGHLSYLVSPRHRVGGGATGTWQKFDETNSGSRPGSQTFYLNLFASWVWAIDETTTLSVRGGPTFVDTHQDTPSTQVRIPAVPYEELGGGRIRVLDFTTCGPDGGASGFPVLGTCSGTLVLDGAEADTVRNLPLQTIEFRSPDDNPGALDDSGWNFFAQTTLTKRWTPTHKTDLSYQRTDSTASGLGSAVLDAVRLTHHWKFAELWTLNFIADFTHRQSTQPQNQLLAEAGFYNANCLTQNGGTAPCLVAGTQTSAFDPNTGLPIGGTFLTYRQTSNSIDTDRWGLGMAISRRITRQLSVGLRYRFNSQNSAKGTAGSPTDFGDHLVTVGVQYDFDRLSLDQYVPW